MVKKQTNEEIQIAVMANDIQYIKESVKEITKTLADDYITRKEFEPVKKIVYGLVSLILIAVITSVIGLIIIKP